MKLTTQFYEGPRWPALRTIRLTEAHLLRIQGLADDFQAEVWNQGFGELVRAWAACGVRAMTCSYGGRNITQPKYYLTVHTDPDDTVTMALNSAWDYPFLILRLMPGGVIEPIWLAGGDFAPMTEALIQWWSGTMPAERVMAPRANPQAALKNNMLYRLGVPRD